MSIRDMEMLGIGKPNDVGGTETEGTVMAKENAILEMLNGYDGKVKNNMILKQTPLKRFTMPSSGILDASVEFEKPVRIVGIYIYGAWKSDNSWAISYLCYVINGEDSYTAQVLPTYKDASIYTFVLNGKSGRFALRNGFSASDMVHIEDIWATKLCLNLSTSNMDIGNELRVYVVYQEEAR